MGITISNHVKSIDLGMGGYLRLRRTISTLLQCDEFTEIYAELCQPNHSRWVDMGFESEAEYWDDYDSRAVAICEKYELDEEVVSFLYRSDCDCDSVSVKTCRHLWKYIKDYDDDILYGYCGRKDCAKFADFKEIVQTCIRDKRMMRFS